MTVLALSLVSHTNVGKTTLARTLLGRDIGEVRDAPHVTEFVDVHPLLQTADGHQLTLWDTPGFGDSVRLLRRLRQSSQPIGWLLSQLWDRWRDRPFWGTQQVVRHVRDTADAVLYLVNASENPAAAGYLGAEMELLAWIGKPVLVLLNQLGPPRAADADAQDLQLWRDHLQRWPQVRQVLPLDAFARCWVQEGALWQAVQAALPAAQQPVMAALRQAWWAQREQVFSASMAAMADSLARLAAARVEVSDAGGLLQGLRGVGQALGQTLGLGPARPAALDAAERTLAALVSAEARRSTDALIGLHGLAGEAGDQVLEQMQDRVDWRRKVDAGPWALLGGLLGGMATGLGADLASGGLTLGGGMLAGGLLGALGSAGVAEGLNRVQGRDRSWIALSPDALAALLQAQLLRYLAVAHFGRGRGQWRDGAAPPHWDALVQQALHAEVGALGELWQSRSAVFDNPGEAERLAPALQLVLDRCSRQVLGRLYPGCGVGDTE